MIIAVANQKGGCAKTTTAVNLAAGLAAAGKKTLLIDIDPQANATSHLNVQVENGRPTLQDILQTQTKKYPDAITPTEIDNLFVVPSLLQLAVTAERLYSYNFRESLLKTYLSTLKGKFAFVIIDCPPNLGILTVNSLYAAELILIPCSMSSASLDGIADLLRTIENLKGNEFQSYYILRTVRDKRNRVTNAFIERELEAVKNHLLRTVVNRTEALNQAYMARKDIFRFDPGCAGAKDYKQLTKEILHYA